MEVRVYYEDTDAAGVVYHSNYLNYFERDRTEFFRKRGLSVRALHEQGWVFPVVKMEIAFRAPAFHDDLLRIETKVLNVGKTSFLLGQRAVRPADGKLLVEAAVTLACTGPHMKARRLPEEILSVLAEAAEE